jgi:2-polyprenyl-3-methyl-5-hydroxy-6-metoxy-1,4-benzoquinol methylase
MDKHPVWWENTSLNELPELSNYWLPLYEDHISACHGETKTAVEIGCFPGGFINAIGKLGYQISGFDTHPEVEKINYLLSTVNEVKAGRFYAESLDDHLKRNLLYDLVISMGFIEHFDDWPATFRKHVELCKPGGTIIIGAPNFSTPLQRALHTVLDKDNIENHCLHSMYPITWKGYMRSLGLTIIRCGRYGEFNFWTQTTHKTNGHLVLSKLIESAIPHAQHFSNRLNQIEGGYSIIVAKKPESENSKLAQDDMGSYFKEVSQHLSNIDDYLARNHINFIESILN